MAAALLLAGAAEPASLELTLTGLRNDRGLVHVCIVDVPRGFPDCKDLPSAVRSSSAAAQAGRITIGSLRPGSYAIAVMHDENGNGRLDTMLKIPREGFGFSRDAPVRFGPPRFSQALVTINPGRNAQTIRVRYVL